MIRTSILLLLGIILLPSLACTPAGSTDIHAPTRIRGLNFVAPPNPFPEDPMAPLHTLGADWIAVCPYAFTRPGDNQVFYNSKRQWWGERPEGVRETVRQAHSCGISVLLKPHVYFPGSWPGDLHFDSDEDWQKWETDYRSYIMEFAQLAAELNVEMFSVGVEFRHSVTIREAFWRSLIQEVREVFDGPVTYAANWDEYLEVPFWDALDYIGIDAYFPLVDEANPTVKTIEKAWKPYLNQIRKMHRTYEKPVLFTEFGYLSVDRCTYNHWELEDRIHHLPVNEQAQADALEALFSVFWNEPWWAGGFLWKWFPNMQGHEGYPSKDYTPQGKLGETTLQKWYSGKY